MYFWKIQNLKNDISNNNFNEHDRFIYATIYIVLCAVGMEAMAWMPIDNPNIWDYIRPISNTTIVLVGTIMAYKSNGGRNGKDFLGRYFSIGFVIIIRFMAILIPLFIILMVYFFYTADENGEVVSTAGDNIPFLIWYAALYWRICNHIKDVSNT